MLPITPPAKISLAHLPTPIRKLERLSESLGCHIWLKSDDQSGFVLSGNKVRKLEFLLADALSKGIDTIITCGGIQSNHCRATAFACAQLGLHCHLVLRNDLGFDARATKGEGNHFLDQLCGASYEIHEPSVYLPQLQSLLNDSARSFSDKGRSASVIPTGGSNGLGVWGYVNAIEELKGQCADLDIPIDNIVCATGSGGTQAGLVLGAYFHNVAAEVLAFAVCDSASYFDKKVRADVRDCLGSMGCDESEIQHVLSAISIDTNDQYIGPGYAKADKDIYDCIAEVSRCEGVLLDPTYTGKAFYGMLSEIKQGRLQKAKNIIFMHTGGAFGLMPHAPYYARSRS